MTAPQRIPQKRGENEKLLIMSQKAHIFSPFVFLFFLRTLAAEKGVATNSCSHFIYNSGPKTAKAFCCDPVPNYYFHDFCGVNYVYDCMLGTGGLDLPTLMQSHSFLYRHRSFSVRAVFLAFFGLMVYLKQLGWNFSQPRRAKVSNKD